MAAGVGYGLDVSKEYYAFALAVPAIVLVLLLRFARVPVRDERLREPALMVGRAAALAAVGVAIIAASVESDPLSTFHAQTRAHLPLAMLAAAAFFALDASRTRSAVLSGTMLTLLTGAGVTVVYAADVRPEWYGVAFAAAGLAIGLAPRAWSPRWLHPAARDAVAAAAVTVGWLPFEEAYADTPRIAAGAHFAAALLYAMFALLRRDVRLDELLGIRTQSELREGVAWLYVAAATLTVGYLHLLSAIGGAEAEGGTPALPLTTVALAAVALGASTRWWRREFAAHLYVVALVLAGIATAASADARELATVVSVMAAAFTLAAAWERRTLLVVPAAIFAAIAVMAWRTDTDAPLAVVPITYTAAALVLYASGLALRNHSRTWSDAIRALGAAAGLLAPAAGFLLVAWYTQDGLIDGTRFERTPLYQWSTLATVAVGLIAVAEAAVMRRGVVGLAGSGIIAVAALLQIGRFSPEDVQPYTLVAGAYLVLVGLVGLRRMRLLPQLDELSPYIEALGAAVVMLPAFFQSLDGAWRYQVLLLVEAAVFFALSVALRRRALLATATVFLVLLAFRSAVDAVNALPNWIVVLLAGMALLAAGMAILLGRDRWDRWQHAMAAWWRSDDAAGGSAAPSPM
jgi:hypothetical protein